MRRSILHVGPRNVKYEIREIVGAVRAFETLGRGEATRGVLHDPPWPGASMS